MSYLSVRSVSSSVSGTCSSSSHLSTPAPLTPNYFPDVCDHPLPNHKPFSHAAVAHIRTRTTDSEDEGLEYLEDNTKEATPTRRSVRRGPTPTSTNTNTSSCDGASSPFDVATPPSIQSYSSAIRETMRKRYDEAYKRMANGDGKMALDLSWEDEDPIDRHVRMISGKSEAMAKAKANAQRDADAGLPSGGSSMLAKAGPSTTTHDDGLPPARPTLLDFRGNSHLNSSSFGSRSEDNTPGSICSEASFEGYSREDWVDMYGRSRSSDASQVTSPLVPLAASTSIPMESPNISFRMSMASISTFGSTSTSSSQATVLPPRPTASSTTGRSSAQAQTQAQQIVPSPSPSHLFAPLPTPAPLSALATGYFAIPTLTVPAPIPRSYPLRPSIGTRQRSRNHPYANRSDRQRDQSSSDVRPPVPSPSVHMDYPDRSESELMVLRAGLRSQRTRAGTRV